MDRITKVALHIILFTGVILITTLSACTPEVTQEKTSLPSNTPTATTIVPTTTSMSPTHTSTPRPTSGPSPTSTPLPALTAFTWQSKPILIEAAHISSDPLDVFSYTPFFVLYGDGLLAKRSCDDQGCRYLQTQLDQDALCQLVNALVLTGFLSADSDAFSVPGRGGNEIRMRVNLYQDNAIQIPDLDRWIEEPGWYQAFIGCTQCFNPPKIDPAFTALYQLVTNYSNPNFTGLKTDRLAVMITKPIIDAEPQPWSETLTSLEQLASQSTCPGEENKYQAVIFEDDKARALIDFISKNKNDIPLFIETDTAWQVQTRWLLPYEMPQSCDDSPGLYPPFTYPNIVWSCNPGMGAIPTATPTITPTPSITPTPLR